MSVRAYFHLKKNITRGGVFFVRKNYDNKIFVRLYIIKFIYNIITQVYMTVQQYAGMLAIFAFLPIKQYGFYFVLNMQLSSTDVVISQRREDLD